MSDYFDEEDLVLWDRPFRSIQEKLEDASDTLDYWLGHFLYFYINPGYDLLGVFNKELSNLAWNIYYDEFDINRCIEHKESKNIIEACKLKHNYLVDCYNRITPWWLPKKEYYNHGI